MDNYIKLKQREDILKLGIIDEDGNVAKDNNGKEVFIEFNLGDIDLPLNYNKCVSLIETAKTTFKNQLIIIDKKQDHKGKGFLTINEEAKAKAMKEFYRQTEMAMDLFLGQGGTKKFLNGKKPYYLMFNDLSEAIEPYKDMMKLKVSDMTDKIKNKYKVSESDVLTSE